MKILLIDDEPFILWLKEWLEGNGQEVVWAKSVTAARNHIARGGFDYVIVDVLMPAPADSSCANEEAQTMGLTLCREILQTKWGKGKVAVYSVITLAEFQDLAKKAELRTTQVAFFSKREDSGVIEKHFGRTLNFEPKG